MEKQDKQRERGMVSWNIHHHVNTAYPDPLFYSILFYSILSYPILYYPILSYPMQEAIFIMVAALTTGYTPYAVAVPPCGYPVCAGAGAGAVAVGLRLLCVACAPSAPALCP
jgi:hypothetical protein